MIIHIQNKKNLMKIKNVKQNDDQRSTTASDEDGSVTPRSVRFVEKPKECEEEVIDKNDTEQQQSSDSEQSSHREYSANVGHKYVLHNIFI